MKIPFSAAILSFSLASGAFAQAPDHARINHLIDALQQTTAVSETALSPNGQSLVWAEGGRNGAHLKVASVADPAGARVITACPAGNSGRESDAVWSPDSKQIAFFSNCTPDHKPGVFVAEADGSGTPKLLAELDGYAHSLAWSPNGQELSFIYVKGSEGPVNALAPSPAPSGVIGVEHIQDQRVATVSAKGGEVAQITPASLYVYEFEWSPDAQKLVYVAAPPPGDDNWWTAEMYTQAIGEAPHVVLDPNTVSGALHGLQIAVPRWSPDGKQIAFIGGLMSDQGVTGGDIYLIPASGGQPKDITPGIASTPTWLHWLGPNRLGFSDIAAGKTAFLSVDPVTGQVKTLLAPQGQSIGDGRLLNSVSLSKNGEVALIASSFAHAPEVYEGQLGGTLHAITHANSDRKPLWGKAESVQWTNDGLHVQGWLLYPKNYDPAKKYPLIVYVHGGPAYANLAHWPYAGYGPVPFSALGYFVLMPNPRGSYGEGERFTKANRKDFGYGDLRDILAGVDAVEKQVPIDNHRVGLTGWSYGGFMTMFAVTQTQRFHAAVAGAGISDWKSYYGENSIDQWMIPFFGASVYNDPAVYAKSSAINFIKNVKTPTLVVVGSNDKECPAPQSYEFWHALRAMHVPTELVVYAGEGHGFYKPADRRNVLERALAWFEQYMPAEKQ
ncbi:MULTISPECIES: S9 family peptidase [Acidobacterium]|uniref:Peptidase, S9C (Acylaminoacyl-peptidase) family n=1 Tax=Acidobacterium capsulatum (strain ATCC 51196 / DSM 11244 / BCRC 80197 / JCM 7670 / NBRC 15755 / NCIMB 13165 / 161) TaxID=240015 RepID=C1F649_ACIC5|nr:MULTISPECIES: S9 family peptidase [Acidobacterium]ACO31580.1 peptidase, S9C (acylaminoacyl-peptidase) family [Acidobacterium capsulatum ATCC 51196]HCT60846.1 S9 family peptidase [Acidobacterium sp.]